MTTTQSGPATDRPGNATDLRAKRARGSKKEFPPPARGKVSDELMYHLVGQGLNGQEIVDTLLSDYGIEFTRAGVSKWKLAHNMPTRVRSENRRNLVPWRVLVEHQQDRLLKFLLTEANLRDRKEIGTAHRYRHQAVLEQLENEGTVVYYDQDNGFHRVQPRPGIDEDFIYDPRIADDGSRITDPELWQ